MNQQNSAALERRSSPRSDSYNETVLCGVQWKPLPVEIRNISQSGALIASVGKLGVGEQITICVPGIGSRSAVVARGNRWLGYGVKFDAPLLAGDMAKVSRDAHSRWVPIGHHVARQPQPESVALKVDLQDAAAGRV